MVHEKTIVKQEFELRSEYPVETIVFRFSSQPSSRSKSPTLMISHHSKCNPDRNSVGNIYFATSRSWAASCRKHDYWSIYPELSAVPRGPSSFHFPDCSMIDWFLPVNPCTIRSETTTNSASLYQSIKWKDYRTKKRRLSGTILAWCGMTIKCTYE